MIKNFVLKASIGPGLVGNVKQVYVTNAMEHLNILKLFKTSFGTTRYNCFASEGSKDPHYMLPGCGNGYTLAAESAEQCDDGNLVNNDGCSSTCLREPGYTCTAATTSKSVCTILCGDGFRMGTEVCDDGNKDDNKGCKADCSGPIAGWACSGGTSTTPDTCNGICGDSLIIGSET